jgi:2-polyprenyl-3-methyl-5-hydroxy-6-metoxy-1,4-benzoquinol methylase
MVMPEIDKFKEHYRKAEAGEKLPWERTDPIRYLDPVHQLRGKPGTALDMGCGSGVDSVHLAQLGWQVTSLDFMRDPLDMTAKRAAEAGVEIELVLADVTEWESDAQFDLLLDSGLLHNMSRDKIGGYRTKIMDWLKPNGDFVLAHWESRTDGDRLRGGARRASRQQIVEYFAPELKEHKFDRLEATGLPERVGPDLSVGFYWFRRT